MLDINMEYRKGILFVRLGGDLSNNNCSILNSSLKKIIDNNNIKFLTFNMSELNNIENEGISIILDYNNTLIRNNGKTFICGIKKIKVKEELNNSKILTHIIPIKDELSAVNYIIKGGYI